MKPILVIAFNRPDETAQLVRRLAEVKPAKLYVAVDGPRLGSSKDEVGCAAVRALFDNLPWTCEVNRNFRETNLGCKFGVSSAISWFFENEEAGIILEDDCIPDPSFFPFCHAMLDRYADDLRIGHVGGFNCQGGTPRGDGSYYFSRYFHVWGWATWRRAWKHFDVALADFSEFRNQQILKSYYTEPEVRQVFENSFQVVSDGRLDTWDYQWVYANIKNSMLAIIPNVNLIQNIGFNENATHTKGRDVEIERLVSQPLVLDRHPTFVSPSYEADRFTFSTHMKLRLREERPPLRSRRGPSFLVRWAKHSLHLIKMAIKSVLLALRILR